MGKIGVWKLFVATGLVLVQLLVAALEMRIDGDAFMTCLVVETIVVVVVSTGMVFVLVVVVVVVVGLFLSRLLEPTLTRTISVDTDVLKVFVELVTLMPAVDTTTKTNGMSKHGGH